MEYKVITPESVGQPDYTGKPVLGISKSAISLNIPLYNLLKGELDVLDQIVLLCVKDGLNIDYYIARTLRKGFRVLTTHNQSYKIGKGATGLKRTIEGFYKKSSPFRLQVNDTPVQIDNYKAYLLITK